MHDETARRAASAPGSHRRILATSACVPSSSAFSSKTRHRRPPRSGCVSVALRTADKCSTFANAGCSGLGGCRPDGEAQRRQAGTGCGRFGEAFELGRVELGALELGGVELSVGAGGADCAAVDPASQMLASIRAAAPVTTAMRRLSAAENRPPVRCHGISLIINPVEDARQRRRQIGKRQRMERRIRSRGVPPASRRRETTDWP